jgi:hypothetical protein
MKEARAGVQSIIDRNSSPSTVSPIKRGSKHRHKKKRWGFDTTTLIFWNRTERTPNTRGAQIPRLTDI